MAEILRIKGKSWVPLGEYPNIYHIYGLYTGCIDVVIGQYGVIFWGADWAPRDFPLSEFVGMFFRRPAGSSGLGLFGKIHFR